MSLSLHVNNNTVRYRFLKKLRPNQRYIYQYCTFYAKYCIVHFWLSMRFLVTNAPPYLLSKISFGTVAQRLSTRDIYHLSNLLSINLFLITLRYQYRENNRPHHRCYHSNPAQSCNKDQTLSNSEFNLVFIINIIY